MPDRPDPAPPAVPVTPAGGCSREMTPRKKEAVRTYLNTLGPKLRARYGRKAYTPQQVHATARENALDVDYVCFAYMLYCAPDDFAALHAAAGEVCDAAAMRAAVADAFFAGNAAFDAVELADGLGGGVVHVAETGADVTLSVVSTGAEVAVNLVSAGAHAALTVVSTGAEAAGAVADGAGAVFGWLADVDWGGLFDVGG